MSKEQQQPERSRAQKLIAATRKTVARRKAAKTPAQPESLNKLASSWGASTSNRRPKKI